MIVRDVLHSEDLAVLLRFLVLWPEGRIGLEIRKSVSVPAPSLSLTHIADPGGGVAEDHHGGAVVVVHQGPEVAAGARLADTNS